jgi:small conductance mechanosensitive channel
VFIIAGAWILHKIFRAIIEKAVRIAVVHDGQSADSEKKREDTLIQVFSTTLKITILTLALLMILQELGVQIGPILAGAGIVGLAFGFGGQYLIRDIISGLFIILENQFRVGDIIRIQDISGEVKEITLRKTTLRDIDGVVHHIPHGEVTTVSNLSKNFARVNLNIGVGYETDMEQLINVVNRVGKELAEHPDWKNSILDAPKFFRVDDLADSAVVIKILGDTIPHKQWEVMGEMRKRLLIEFRKEGIEIPFPQRVVHQAK